MIDLIFAYTFNFLSLKGLKYARYISYNVLEVYVVFLYVVVFCSNCIELVSFVVNDCIDLLEVDFLLPSELFDYLIK